MRSFGAGLIGAGIMAEVAHFTMAPIGFDLFFYGGIVFAGVGFIIRGISTKKG